MNAATEHLDFDGVVPNGQHAAWQPEPRHEHLGAGLNRCGFGYFGFRLGHQRRGRRRKRRQAQRGLDSLAHGLCRTPLARGLQLQPHAVRLAPQLSQLLLRGRLRMLPDLAVLLFGIAQQAAGAYLQGGGLGGFLESAGARILGDGAFAGDLVQQGLGLTRLRRDVGAGSVEDFRWHAQALGDRQGVGPSGSADHQPIGRRERLDVELDARVLDARHGLGVALQLGIVRRGDDVGAAFAQEIEQRPSDRRALLWVGARAELVEQDQRAAVGFAQHSHNARDVARKRGEALLQALLVADVGLHPLEDRHQRALVGGHEQTGLRHQRQQAGGLEGDRFAACVRAGDQQDVELAAQVEADRHHGAGQQRMASLDQLEHGLAGRARQADKLRRSSALLLGQASRGTCKVDLRQALDAAEERLGLFAHLLAQRAQDALDFVLLVQDQRAPAIGHLDHGDRLDEQRGAAGRLIVDDAGHLPARLGADRNNVATVPLGDHRVLDHIAERWRGHDLAQARDQAIVGAAQLGPNATQRGAGGIQDLAAFLGTLAGPIVQSGRGH